MRNMKRTTALAMATVLTLGSSMSVLAADANSGSLGGTGTSTGHLDTKVFSVELPTVASGDTTFNYYADPEGHIAETGFASDGTAVTSNANGVYFLNAGSAGSAAVDAAIGSYSITVGGTAVTSGLTITGHGANSTVSGDYTYSDTDGKWKDSEGTDLSETLTIKQVTTGSYSPVANDEISVDGDGNVTGVKLGGDTTVANFEIVVGGNVEAAGTYKYDGTNSKWVLDGGSDEITVTTLNTKTETPVTPEDGDTITLTAAIAAVAPGAASYSAASDTLTVTNKSNVSADITATVAVTANEKNMALAESETALTSATDPTLYLGLLLGSTETAILSTGATKTVTVAGVDGYEEVYDNTTSKYKMAEKASHDAWKTTTIGLKGKVAETDVATDTVAPAITVTWSYAETPTAPEEPEVTAPKVVAEGGSVSDTAVTSISVGGKVDILLPDGVTITGVEKRKTDGSFNALPNTYYNLTAITNGQKFGVASNLLSTYSASTQVRIVLSEGDPIILSVTAN